MRYNIAMTSQGLCSFFNAFAAGFGPVVEVVALALLVALGVWGIWRMARRMLAILNAQMSESTLATRLALLALLCALAPMAVSKYTNDVNGTGAPMRPCPLAAISPTTAEGPFDAGANEDGLRFTEIVISTNSVILALAWTNGLAAVGDHIDIFVCTNLVTPRWTWLANTTVASGMTNCVFDVPADSPAVPFSSSRLYKASLRESAATTMADVDLDGIPDVYELHLGTNPYVDDWDSAPRIAVSNSASLGEALNNSDPYTIIELDADEMVLQSAQTMPPTPVLVTGPRGRMARVRFTSPAGAFVLRDGQDSQTAFRNLYVELAGTGNVPEVGFWCGASTPFVLERGSATFENIYIRMMNPEPRYYGWFIRRYSDHEVAVRNCTINAAGAGNVTGIAAIDSPAVRIEGCSFLNFPATPGNSRCGVQVESVRGGWTNVSVSVERCLFDESFANQYPIGWIEDGSPVRVAMRDCIVPGLLSDYLPDPLEGLVVTNGQVLWNGYLRPDSRAAIDGIGSLGVLAADSTLDSDGDGLTDYRESYHVGTNPWQRDSDGDDVDDAVELVDETDPLDSSNFRFSMSGCITNDYVRSGVLAGVFTGDSPEFRCAGPCALTNFVNDVAWSDVVVTNGTRLVLRVWNDLNTNGEWEVDEPAVTTYTHKTEGHNFAVNQSVPQTLTDADRDDLPDLWEVAHGLSPTNAVDAFADPDGDGLINLHEFWAGADPSAPDGSNTLVWALTNSIDERIKGRSHDLSTMEVYTDYAIRFNALTNELSLTLAPNENCWAHGLDFSAVGICSQAYGATNITHGLFPTAISDRHIIFAKHCGARTNDCYRFRTPDGVYTNLHLMGYKVCDDSDRDSDLMVGILDGTLPSSIRPVQFLPEDYHHYIGRGNRLPTLRLNQWGEASVQEIDLMPSQIRPRTDVAFRFSEDVQRSIFFNNVIWADSGHPSFFLCGDDLIFLFTAHHTFDWRRVTSVPAISLKAEIEVMMNGLCEDFDLTNRYQILEYDFSSYGQGGGR